MRGKRRLAYWKEINVEYATLRSGHSSVRLFSQGEKPPPDI